MKVSGSIFDADKYLFTTEPRLCTRFQLDELAEVEVGVHENQFCRGKGSAGSKGNRSGSRSSWLSIPPDLPSSTPTPGANPDHLHRA